MTMTWTYGARIVEDEGDFVVSVRDLPEVVTSGSTFAEALELAADAIEVAVMGRMEDELQLPEPNKINRNEIPIPLRATIAAKAAVYTAWRASGLKKTELARRLHRHETEVRRILDPRHGTKLDLLEDTARALGGRLVVSFESTP
jgi:antitoxin HicB